MRITPNVFSEPARLEGLDADLLELGPVAGAVCLQLDVALFLVLKAVVLANGVAVDPHQTAAAFHDQVKRKRLLRLNFRVNGALEVIERTCWKISLFHVMQLDFVVPAAQALAGRPE